MHHSTRLVLVSLIALFLLCLPGWVQAEETPAKEKQAAASKPAAPPKAATPPKADDATKATADAKDSKDAEAQKAADSLFEEFKQAGQKFNTQMQKYQGEYKKLTDDLRSNFSMEKSQNLENKRQEILRFRETGQKALLSKMRETIAAFEKLFKNGILTEKSNREKYGMTCYMYAQYLMSEQNTWDGRVYVLKIKNATPKDDYEVYSQLCATLAQMELQVGNLDKAEKYISEFNDTIKKSGETPFANKKEMIEAVKQFQSQIAEKRKTLADIQKRFDKEEKPIRDAEDKANDLPKVKIETSKGDIVLLLYENEAPNTVANFISLAEKGFYKGLTFHRVIEGFMAQGGDPNGDGTGGPGYKIKDELTPGKFRKHYRGVISMAKSSAPNSAGSQFFITTAPTPHLDGVHTVFGRVIKGMDVVDNLRVGDIIKNVVVLSKRKHEYKPEIISDTMPKPVPAVEKTKDK